MFPEIAQENSILPKNLINWKKQFLENAEIAMEPAKAVLAVKPINTTVADDHHPKYPYLLKGVNIDRPNKV